jgi:signal transduction histidine kinase
MAEGDIGRFSLPFDSASTGLGLSLCKPLAELLGGGLGVQSELGRGSTFSVAIPTQYSGPEKDTDTNNIGKERSHA